MDKYTTLVAALAAYRGDVDLDNTQRRLILERDIAAGFVDRMQLATELGMALSDSELDWVAFARSNSLIIDSSDATEIAAYVKSLFQGLLQK
jgi:hypothetical protein